MAKLTAGNLAHDAGRKLVTDSVKRWAEANIKSPEGVTFAVEIMDGAYDLVLESVRNGGTLSKGDVVAFMAKRGGTFSGLSGESALQCATALMDLGFTAATYSETVAVPAVGWIVYASLVGVDLMTAGGECYLAYQDRAIESQAKEYQQQFQSRKAWAKSNAALATRTSSQLAADFQSMLKWKDRRPNQCVLPENRSRLP